MSTLNTAATKQNLTARRSNVIARALFVRKLNKLLSLMGRALNTAAMSVSK